MTQPAAPAPPTPFLDLFHALEEGEFLPNADAALIELVTKLKAHREAVGGKATGSITIVIKMTDDGKVVELLPKLDLRTPTPVRMRSFMFRTKENTLSRQHPAQMKLPLTDATAPAAVPVTTDAPSRPALVANDA